MIAEFNHGQESAIYKLEFEDFLPEDIKKRIRYAASELGFKVTINEIESPEEYVANYYERQGYKVMDCRIDARWSLHHNEPNDMRLASTAWHDDVPQEFKDACRETGSPDFFCWKNKDDYFFLEAKRDNDSFRITQVMWLFKHRFRFKLFYSRTSIKKPT